MMTYEAESIKTDSLSRDQCISQKEWKIDKYLLKNEKCWNLISIIFTCFVLAIRKTGDESFP